MATQNRCGLCGLYPYSPITDCEHEPGETHGAIIDGLCAVCRGGLADLGITPQQWRNQLRFSRGHASYNYCGICGHTPQNTGCEPNRAPIRWWDPDDGWKIGTLCRGCFEDYGNRQPKETDFAYHRTNGSCDDCNTDEDAAEALEL